MASLTPPLRAPTEGAPRGQLGGTLFRCEVMMLWKSVGSCAALAMLLTGCASSSAFHATWTNADAAPVSLSGKKVMAIVQIRNESRRREAEDALAAAITSRGGQGIASYTLFPSNAKQQDEAVAERKAKAAGFSGIVMMSVTARERRVARDRYGSAYWMNDPYYRYPWGAWGNGWNTMWEPNGFREEVRVMVDTRVYSIEQDKLLWTGSSETLNPESAGDVIRDLSAELTRELESAGVLRRGVSMGTTDASAPCVSVVDTPPAWLRSEGA